MTDSKKTNFKLPRFSAIITSHNYENYIGSTLKSVAAQTYENCECIIVDDCSTDGSRELIKKFIARHPSQNFRLIESDENVGQMGAMKLGVSQASGHFIGFLDADDVWAPDYVRAHIVAHLNSSYTSGMSSCDMLVIDSDDFLLQGTWRQLRKERDVQEPRGGLVPVYPADACVLQGQFPNYDETRCKVSWAPQHTTAEWYFCPTSACVFRRGLVDLMMPTHTEGFRLSADYFFNMQASIFTDCLTINVPLAAYRIHGSNGFSENPVVGGDYRPGKWRPSMKTEYDERIAQHIRMHFEAYADVFGPEKVGGVLGSLLGPTQLPQKASILTKMAAFKFQRPK